MGFSPQAGQIDPEAIIVAFNREGVRLALQVAVPAKDQAVGMPEVGAEGDINPAIITRASVALSG